MTQSHRTRLENSCILLLFLFSLGMFLFSFLHHSPAEAALLIGTEMDWMVQRALSLVLICLCRQLKKRKRAALDTALILFLLNIVRSFPQLTSPRHLISGLVSLLLFLLFFHFRSDFCCPASKADQKRGFSILLLSFLGVIANAAISYHYLSPLLGTGSHTILNSLTESLSILFGNGSTLSVPHNAKILELTLFWFSWCCILAAFLYTVRPWIAASSRHESDLQHARTLLNLYSQNNCSYLALEDDKQLYFGHQVDGVIPYGVVGDTIIVNGDPVCADDDFPVLLQEFREFCE